MLTRAQCCRVDDQRGLLTKEQLEVPLFLKVASDREQNSKPEGPSAANSCADDSKETPSSAGAAKETPDSAPSEAKDVRETSV